MAANEATFLKALDEALLKCRQPATLARLAMERPPPVMDIFENAGRRAAERQAEKFGVRDGEPDV